MESFVDDRVMLKVKSRSLAVEAQIIRHEERRTNYCIRCGKWKRDHIRDWTTPFGNGPNADVSYQRLICEEGGKQFKGARPRKYHALHGHRVYHVRREARATHLARMFLSGRPYTEVESAARTQPDWTKVAKLIAKYASRETLEGREYARWRELAFNEIHRRQVRLIGGVHK